VWFDAGGCFGTVYKGICRGKPVAVKKLHAQDLESDLMEEFRKEVKIMTYVITQYIVNMFFFFYINTTQHTTHTTLLCSIFSLSFSHLLTHIRAFSF
jgi:hypothetical protein